MYDLIILGAGPAGYHAAERAADGGLNVALVEKNLLGGVCLNEGCIPSKTILYSAKLFSHAKDSERYGIKVNEASFDFGAVMARKKRVVERLRKGIEFSLKKRKVALVGGRGTILSSKGREGSFRVKVGDDTIEGSRLLLCTGSEPVRPPISGADRGSVLTSGQVFALEKAPEKLAVIGGGVIGLELATFFAEIGSRVAVIEMLPAIGGVLDRELSGILQKELGGKGIEFFLEAEVVRIEERSVVFNSGGASKQVPADAVLLSVGRRPVIEGFGLEELGLWTENRAVCVDSRGRTSLQGVWAAGDINGKSMLAHTAYREADVCVNDILGIDDSVNYDAVPGVIYTAPEVASVGLTSEEAGRRGYDAVEKKLPMSYSGRYLAENDMGRGVCKVVVEKKSSRVLGVHMIGSACSEMIWGAAMMVERDVTVQDAQKIVFPHPTVSEIIKDTLLS